MFILLLIIIILLLLILARLQGGRRGPPPPPPVKIPSSFGPPELTAVLQVRLAGTPADGSMPPASAPAKVVWVEKGDEVLVHLDSMQVKIGDSALLVSIDLETDQTGRTPLVVPFALGASGDLAGLIAVTDDIPRGNGLLAARWGKAVQSATWSSLLALAQDHATERNAAPHSITLAGGQLHLHAAPPTRLTSSP